MPELGDGAVTIADLFRSLSAIQSSVSQLVTRFEVMSERAQTAGIATADHETRLRALETTKARLWGMATAFGAVAGGLVAWITTITHH